MLQNIKRKGLEVVTIANVILRFKSKQDSDRLYLTDLDKLAYSRSEKTQKQKVFVVEFFTVV